MKKVNIFQSQLLVLNMVCYIKYVDKRAKGLYFN